MLRSILAVVAAIFTWFLTATVLNLVLRATLSGYSAAEPTLAFTLPMMISRLALGLMASLAAGLACAAVAKRGIAAKVAAGIMLLLFLPVHYMLWAKFPIWYHLFFLITLAPTMLIGATLVRRPAVVRTSATV